MSDYGGRRAVTAHHNHELAVRLCRGEFEAADAFGVFSCGQKLETRPALTVGTPDLQGWRTVEDGRGHRIGLTGNHRFFWSSRRNQQIRIVWDAVRNAVEASI